MTFLDMIEHVVGNEYFDIEAIAPICNELTNTKPQAITNKIVSLLDTDELH